MNSYMLVKWKLTAINEVYKLSYDPFPNKIMCERYYYRNYIRAYQILNGQNLVGHFRVRMCPQLVVERKRNKQ